MAVCEGCGKSVIWYKNDKTGKAAPVNPEPVPDGNVTLVDDGQYHVMTKAERQAADEPSMFDDGHALRRFVLHFATCTKPEAFRRRDQKAHKVIDR